ncbi:MAG: sigma-54-dependent Fis family transcriptional regulator [Gemmatimonadales bacterium]|nr:sigma-54-dependent Fis family transcriptional regulator [Gemmatimonadales bacterium]
MTLSPAVAALSDPAADRTRRLIAVQLDEMGASELSDLARANGLVVQAWKPTDGERMPSGVAVVVLAGGGHEREALDLIGDLPADETPIVVVGGVPDHRIAIAAVRRGAQDYFALPEDLELLRRAVEREVAQANARSNAAAFAATERDEAGFGMMLGRSTALTATLDHAARVAPRKDVTVLIRGETGTGKELLARAIHYHSPRASEPFVEINCAAIPGTLLESELFGHEKGSFTGAIAAKAGLFELAHGGTIFLDEIGNLPIDLQPKLLRALETHAVRRVGGRAERHVDVRVIAATHVDLASAVGRNEFREDLFYRLNVVSLMLPPLRYREGDVTLLAEHFLDRLARSYALPVPALGAAVRTKLNAHHWPGNVRELRNVIERALILSPPGELAAEEVLNEDMPAPQQGNLPFPTDLATLSRAAARAMVDLSGGNKSEAARRLGISRPRLQRLLYSLHAEDDGPAGR